MLWKSAFLFALAAVHASPLTRREQIPLTSESFDNFDWDLSEHRLVQTENQEPKWVTEWEKIRMKAEGVKFFDITEVANSQTHVTQVAHPYFAAPNATEKVLPVLELLSTAGPKENLEKFSSFRTRHYRSSTGRDSQKWLINKISEITAKHASPALQSLISIREFEHSWSQNSIIARINGSSPTDGGIVVIGAHQDSTNLLPFLPAPGADDDGSGSVTILEAYRALISADFHPVENVEFHWYSAEEGGLLGSQAIASAYSDASLNVVAMSQFDMTAWVKRGTKEEVGIIVDFTDESLTKFNEELVNTYLSIPYVETKCGYACSDHASWGKFGYPSSFTIESSFENSNNHIHSSNDRIDISDEFSFPHMLEFSKLAVAFAIELAGWD